jgi:Na+(H+)/acetate symporter ActP
MAMPETIMRFLARVEIINAVASVAMTIGLIIACILLTANYNRLGKMEHQLAERNEQGTRGLKLADERNVQGQQQLELLAEAVRRLER